MKTRVAELQTIKTKAEKENREFSQEETDRVNLLSDEIDGFEISLESALAEERMTDRFETMNQSQRKPIKPDMKKSREEERKFSSFGDFLQAVYRAGIGQMVDNRLDYQARAASGLGEGIPSDGGFLVQTDFAAGLIKRVYETGQVVSRARRIPISGSANGIKLNAIAETSRAAGSRWGGIRGYWGAEAATKTASAPKFRQMELTLKKLIGLCYATDELLADAAALESVIMQGFSEEFGFLLDDSLINGTGAGQPLGIMTSPSLVTVTRNTALHVYSEDVIAMWARCWAKSRPNAVWFINQAVEPELHKLNLGGGTAGTGVILTYMPPGGLSASPYGTIYGRPVIPIEQCAALGTTGDIILADFSEYVMIEKGGMQSASSIHVRFVNDETTFRFVMRVDGQPAWNAPLTPYKGTGTLSPFVVLNTV
jgi:HK97 family phage major capsid protein